MTLAEDMKERTIAGISARKKREDAEAALKKKQLSADLALAEQRAQRDMAAYMGRIEKAADDGHFGVILRIGVADERGVCAHEAHIIADHFRLSGFQTDVHYEPGDASPMSQDPFPTFNVKVGW